MGARGDETTRGAKPRGPIRGRRGSAGGPGGRQRGGRGLRGASEDALDREAKNHTGACSRTVSTLHVGVGLPINHKMLRSRKLAKCAFATGRGHAAGRKSASSARVAHMSLSSGGAPGMVFGRASEIAQRGASACLRSVRRRARGALHRLRCARMRRALWVHRAMLLRARNAVHMGPGDLSGSSDSTARIRKIPGFFRGSSAVPRPS